MHQSKNEKIQCDERITSLETQNTNHKIENERLHQLLKNTQDNLTHYQQAIEKQRAEQHMHLEKERAEYALKLTALEKQLNKMLEEKYIIETKNLLLIDESHIQKNNIEKMNQLNSQLQIKNSELIIQNNHLNLENGKLQNEVVSIENKLTDHEKSQHELHIQLAVLKNENITINKNHELCEVKIEQLKSEISKLMKEEIV